MSCAAAEELRADIAQMAAKIDQVLWPVLSTQGPGFLTWSGFANSIGQLAVVLYITLAIISMIPFHCYLYPDGKTSIIEYPTVLCDDSGKYPDMLAMGIIGVLLNVPRWY